MTLRQGADIAALRRRAELLTRMRAWFSARGILEVETASLSSAATPDPAIASLRATGVSGTGFLHTSPEYMMKRLIAAGSGDIWQLCRVYRDGEIGRWHEPEFMLLEWYRVGCDDSALMHEVENLLTELLGPARLCSGAVRVSYDDAFRSELGLPSQAGAKFLRQALRSHAVDVPAGLRHGELLDLAMSTVVSARFSSDRLTFVHDYPVSQAALARINQGDPPTAARFEVFLGDLELGNGFYELTDAEEQRARFERENTARIDAGLDPVPLDEPFLGALAQGLPECSGVALGFDRIVAAAIGADSLADVVAFTHSKISP